MGWLGRLNRLIWLTCLLCLPGPTWLPDLTGTLAWATPALASPHVAGDALRWHPVPVLTGLFAGLLLGLALALLARYRRELLGAPAAETLHAGFSIPDALPTERHTPYPIPSPGGFPAGRADAASRSGAPDLADTAAQAIPAGLANPPELAADPDTSSFRSCPREQRLDIFDSAPVGIFRVTPDGRYEHVNAEYARIWGCGSTSEMLACVNDIAHQMYAHPDDRQRFVLALRAAGRVDRMELRLKRRDGSQFWGLVSARLVRSSSGPHDTGDTEFIDGFVLDITEQKVMQDQLAEAWRRMRDIIDFLPDATLVLDANRRVIAWNRAMEEMTARTAGEMLGRSSHDCAVPFYGARAPLLGDRFFTPGLPLPPHYSMFGEQADKLTAEAHVPSLFDGRGAYVWTMASALRDAEGRLLGVIQTIRDMTEHRVRVQELERSRQRYDMAISATNDGIWEWEHATASLYHSPRCLEILGWNAGGEASLAQLTDTLHPADRLGVLSEVRRVTGGNADRFEHEFRIRHSDGTWRWVLARGAALRGPTGKLERVAGALADISARKQGEVIAGILFHIANALNETRDLGELFQSIHAALRRHVQASNFFIALVNEKEDRLDFAYFADEVDDQYSPLERISDPAVDCPTLEVIRSGKQLHLHRKELEQRYFYGSCPAVWLGTPLRSRGTVIGAMVMQHYGDPEFFTARDAELMVPVAEQVAVAIERKQGEEMLTHLALHDALTGLPNRALLLDRIDRAIQRGRRHGNYRFAVMLLDLDRFKLINDSHGHATGDSLLVEVARRMRPVVRGGDTVARLGGDEFALLLEDVDSPRRVVQITRRLLATLERPVRIGQRVVRTSASIGIVLRTAGYESAEGLLRDADTAMYQAKAQGKGRFRLFNTSMHRHAMELLTIESDLSMALRRKQLYLEYQPVFAVDDGRLLGFEALVRWRHPTEGIVPPARFIPIAEENGLILRIGQWVLEQAASTLAEWRAALPEAHNLFVSVNLSARQASQMNLTGRVARVLADSGLPPGALKLEITETAIMKDPDGALQRLAALRKLGVGIGIDDFGTGYSSLAYLQRFPVDTLKVDRSFVSAMGHDAENREIVRTVVTLGRSLGLMVVAEGVENVEQLSVISELGCHAVQGYHFSRPVSEDLAVGFITAGNAAAVCQTTDPTTH